jgi:4-amino-4-deoxy-L-arabinose transferase-like glycosyltransferase
LANFKPALTGWRTGGILAALGLAVLYAALRLPGIATWAPLLNDEAIELHRALLIHADCANLWISNVEYKPPLFYWLASLLVGHVPDPRLAVRLISAAAGLGSLLVVVHVARRYAGGITAVLAGALFLVLPANQIQQRLGQHVVKDLVLGDARR